MLQHFIYDIGQFYVTIWHHMAKKTWPNKYNHYTAEDTGS